MVVHEEAGDGGRPGGGELPVGRVGAAADGLGIGMAFELERGGGRGEDRGHRAERPPAFGRDLDPPGREELGGRETDDQAAFRLVEGDARLFAGLPRSLLDHVEQILFQLHQDRDGCERLGDGGFGARGLPARRHGGGRHRVEHEGRLQSLEETRVPPLVAARARVEHDEEGEQKGHEVGIGEQPAVTAARAFARREDLPSSSLEAHHDGPPVPCERITSASRSSDGL